MSTNKEEYLNISTYTEFLVHQERLLSTENLKKRVTFDLQDLGANKEEKYPIVNTVILGFIRAYHESKNPDLKKTSFKFLIVLKRYQYKAFTYSGPGIVEALFYTCNAPGWHYSGFLDTLNTIYPIKSLTLRTPRHRLSKNIRPKEIIFELIDGFSIEDEDIEWFYFCDYGIDGFIQEHNWIKNYTIFSSGHGYHWDHGWSDELLDSFGRQKFPWVKRFNFPVYPMHLRRLKKIFPNLDWPLLSTPGMEDKMDMDHTVIGKVGQVGDSYLKSLEKAKKLFTGFLLSPIEREEYPNIPAHVRVYNPLME